MKKIIYIVVIVAAVLGLFYMASMGKDDPIVAEKIPAEFAFESNLQLAVDETVDVEVNLNSEDIQKTNVIFDDTVLVSWDNPTGSKSFKLDGSLRGLGAKKLDLVSVLKDGKKKTDSRMVRVVSDVVPTQMKAQIVKTYPHNNTSFTQGLEFYNGKLFEGTGQYGQSKVFEVELSSGKQSEERIFGLDATHFGEGITILNDVVYQLTWQNQKCLTYDLGDVITPKSEFAYNGEGWGLCNDGTSLIMSNGTERIQFRNPETFLVEKTIEVYNNNGPVIALNELEFINGFIYANVWMQNKVVVIDPESGKVLQEIDGSILKEKGQGADQEVMNGIAYNPETKKTYMTGKNWIALFEVEFVEP